ncbi:hypothetical protein EAH87_14755 [Sphingomonas koreensis]|nr:hypothetical protein EAH87_14755 [Sphingomonas koreensis]
MRVGGFDANLRTNEDWDLWLRVARSGARFATGSEQSAYYWNSGASLTRDSGTMVRDVALVMARAQAADPRVPAPLPHYAHGLTLGDMTENLLSCALWSGAADIGCGGDGTAALDALPPTVGTPWHREALVGTMIEGLMVGSGGSYGTLCESWDGYAARLSRFCFALPGCAGLPRWIKR